MLTLHNFSQLRFWRNLTLYFLVFSFVGHWLEIVFALFAKYVLHQDFVQSILTNWSEPYSVYGAGVVFCIIVFRLLPRKITRHLSLQYLIYVIICAIVEYTAAQIIVWRFGENIFWDYSNQPFNLNGYIYLTNSLLFGLAAMVFILGIYPAAEKFLEKTGDKVLNLALVILAVIFTVLYFI
jgi:uncharacterized membrane protein